MAERLLRLSATAKNGTMAKVDNASPEPSTFALSLSFRGQQKGIELYGLPQAS